MKTNQNPNSLASDEPRYRSGGVIHETPVRINTGHLYLLAYNCAARIHSAVISMHLQVVRREGDPNYIDHRDVDEVRALLRSLDQFARWTFVHTVKCEFQRIRKERGTEVRWQTYRDKVLAYRQKEAA